MEMLQNNFTKKYWYNIEKKEKLSRQHNQRHIRAVWWDKRGFAGELKPQYLTESQQTRSAVYLVLWKYALPQLTNWVDNDRFLGMIDFYKSRYGEEIEAVFRDGVEYDDDQNSVIDDDEKIPINDGRLVR